MPAFIGHDIDGIECPQDTAVRPVARESRIEVDLVGACMNYIAPVPAGDIEVRDSRIAHGPPSYLAVRHNGGKSHGNS